MATQTTKTQQRTQTLHQALVNSRQSWKRGKVSGRCSVTGEPLDIIVEPVIGSIMVMSANHTGEPSDSIHLFANTAKDIADVRKAFANIGPGFRFETDELRHCHFKADAYDATREIEELISTLTRDTQ